MVSETMQLQEAIVDGQALSTRVLPEGQPAWQGSALRALGRNQVWY